MTAADESAYRADDVSFATNADRGNVDDLPLLDWIVLMHNPSAPRIRWRRGDSSVTFSLRAGGGNTFMVSVHTVSK